MILPLNKQKYIVWIFALLFLCTANLFAQEGPYGVHDPVMIKQDSTYYLFCTGMGISCFSSTDRINWKREAPVFNTPPEWAVKDVPGFKGHIWAPDVFFHKGKYWLLYAVSAFGKNTSCIGLAENATLNPNDKNFQWIDLGKIIQSVPGRDDWNAIDPNMIFDDEGHPWVNFGSFWSGIKMVKITDDLSGIAQPEEWYGLAKRPRSITAKDGEAGDDAIEAPFIFKKDSYYYLFVSFDYCCRGVNSTYKVMVGRSEKITGPYMDKTGTELRLGGGSPVVVGNEKYPGVGHCGVYNFDGKDYIIFHGYDSTQNGRSRLIIKELHWDTESWPYIDKL